MSYIDLKKQALSELIEEQKYIDNAGTNMIDGTYMKAIKKLNNRGSVSQSFLEKTQQVVNNI